MLKKIREYKTLIFDCDGVILNSNKIKTEAFYQVALPYGEKAAQALVDYHIANGGISRYKKFAYFFENLVPNDVSKEERPNLEQLLASYAEYVLNGLLSCEVAEGLEELKMATPGANWLIVSGGDQQELRKIFATRNLDYLFNSGIFGSPGTKDQILAHELGNGNIALPALFLGDSKYDYQAATTAKLDFIFLSGWTEMKNWRSWAGSNQIPTLKKVKEFLS